MSGTTFTFCDFRASTFFIRLPTNKDISGLREAIVSNHHSIKDRIESEELPKLAMSFVSNSPDVIL
jgi:hypothetical protein